MSASNIISNINSILDPVLFQVVGSTPESIVENVRKAQLKGKTQVATRLFAISIFAAAVNKKTLETFMEKPELADVRSTMMASFNIQGRTNMTGLTLLGHCLLTTSMASDIVFAREFRRKMGQNDLWDGNLDSGSLGDTQKKILKEKQRLTNAKSAKLLGSGFLKYTGMSTDRMTAEEAKFWSEPHSTSSTFQNPIPPVATSSGTSFPPSPPQQTATTSRRGRVTAPQQAEAMTSVTLSDGTAVSAPTRIVDYYLAIRGGNQAALINSIERDGVDTFIATYGRAEAADPERRGFGGTSVIT